MNTHQAALASAPAHVAITLRELREPHPTDMRSWRSASMTVTERPGSTCHYVVLPDGRLFRMQVLAPARLS
jgi:hypothetical protein